MLTDEKILITGPAGQIAFPMAAYLAESNEVWGIARFTEEGSRQRVEDVGVTTRVVDLATGDYGDLPDDFTYLVHMAAYQGAGEHYDTAMAINAEGTGLLMHHCRSAKAALVASTFSVYDPNADPWHAYVESDPLGDCHPTHSRPYSVSKIAEEAVARTMARMLDLPVTIGRINASYGPNGGLPAYHLDWIAAGEPVTLRTAPPSPYSPIHQDDMNRQVEPLLAAASVPATIVNWAGDEGVPAEDWCAFFGELTGKEPIIRYEDRPGTQIGSVSDSTKRIELTGPCEVSWRDGFRRMYEARYPGGERATGLPGGADRLRDLMDENRG